MAPSDPIAELVRLLARLPGIGERSAGRLAFHVLAADPAYAGALGTGLSELHTRVKRCADCGNYGSEERCSICTDPRRDDNVICVVARVPDLHAIERSGSFRGRYHVLHRLLAPLDGVGPADLPLDALVDRVKRLGTTEVIVATPLNGEGPTMLFAADPRPWHNIGGSCARAKRTMSCTVRK